MIQEIKMFLCLILTNPSDITITEDNIKYYQVQVVYSYQYKEKHNLALHTTSNVYLYIGSKTYQI